MLRLTLDVPVEQALVGAVGKCGKVLLDGVVLVGWALELVED